MNKFGKVVLAAALLGCGFGLGSVVVSNADSALDSNQPGSVHDPLITKSYVDQQLASLVQAEVAKLQEGGSGTSSSSGKALVVERLSPGESIVASAGTEFIVTHGSAVAFSNTDDIPDLTSGLAIKDGQQVPEDHLLLFPRDDGRGIKSIETGSESYVWVMIRGDYVVLDSEGNVK